MSKPLLSFPTSLILLSCTSYEPQPSRKEQLERYMKKNNFALKLRDESDFFFSSDTLQLEPPYIEYMYDLKGGKVLDFVIETSTTDEFLVSDYTIRGNTLHLTLENVNNHFCLCPQSNHYRFEVWNTNQSFDHVAFYLKNCY